MHEEIVNINYPSKKQKSIKQRKLTWREWIIAMAVALICLVIMGVFIFTFFFLVFMELGQQI